jgi:IS5 family transposase
VRTFRLGYKGEKQISATLIQIPDPGNARRKSRRNRERLRNDLRRRAAIEPVIGHLKTDHRLCRNFYKGVFGDAVNLLLTAAAFNGGGPSASSGC